MKLFLLNVFFFLSFGSYSQSVISSSGNTKNNGDFILSWTIGEGVISTIGNNDKELSRLMMKDANRPVTVIMLLDIP